MLCPHNIDTVVAIGLQTNWQLPNLFLVIAMHCMTRNADKIRVAAAAAAAGTSAMSCSSSLIRIWSSLRKEMVKGSLGTMTRLAWPAVESLLCTTPRHDVAAQYPMTSVTRAIWRGSDCSVRITETHLPPTMNSCPIRARILPWVNRLAFKIAIPRARTACRQISGRKIKQPEMSKKQERFCCPRNHATLRTTYKCLNVLCIKTRKN